MATNETTALVRATKRRVKNTNLHKAKTEKNDEFYSQLTDVNRELWEYKAHFVGKSILCNANDREDSAFLFFFRARFDELSLKRVVAVAYTGLTPGEKAYKIVLDRDENGKIRESKVFLEMDGDFRSPECVELLRGAEVVCTNPPFSAFRDFLNLLIEHDKKFVIIGNNNAITYKEVFKHIKENRLWLGVNPRGMDFVQPDGSKLNVNACWFTNLPNRKRNEALPLHREYEAFKHCYPKYDNYDAIEVSKVAEIPGDYDGFMGVPITFLSVYCPEQFEIVGNEYDLGIEKGRMYITGERIYSRIIIKRRPEWKRWKD